MAVLGFPACLKTCLGCQKGGSRSVEQGYRVQITGPFQSLGVQAPYCATKGLISHPYNTGLTDCST